VVDNTLESRLTGNTEGSARDYTRGCFASDLFGVTDGDNIGVLPGVVLPLHVP